MAGSACHLLRLPPAAAQAPTHLRALRSLKSACARLSRRREAQSPSALVEAGDSFSLVVMDVEDGVKLGDLKEVVDLFRKVQQLQRPALV